MEDLCILILREFRGRILKDQTTNKLPLASFACHLWDTGFAQYTLDEIVFQFTKDQGKSHVHADSIR